MDLKPRFSKGGIQLRKSKKLQMVGLYTSEEERVRGINPNLNLDKKDNEDLYQVRGYGFSEEIELSYLPKTIFGENMQYKREDECVYYFDLNTNQYIFIFDFGVVVIWNYTLYQENKMLNKIQTAFIKRFTANDVSKEIMYVSKKLSQTSKIDQNTIYLTTNDVNEKFAQSYSMAQGLKLEYYERKVDQTIQGAKGIPKTMALYGEINISQKEVYKKIGNVIVLRSSINLISGMLDLPDCFWDNDTCENIYNKSKEYYNIDDRIEIINNRLDQLKELYDILNNDLHHKQMSNIKWIVIFLISLEIFIELFWNGLLKTLFGLQQLINYQIGLSSVIRLGRHKIIIIYIQCYLSLLPYLILLSTFLLTLKAHPRIIGGLFFSSSAYYTYNNDIFSLKKYGLSRNQGFKYPHTQLKKDFQFEHNDTQTVHVLELDEQQQLEQEQELMEDQQEEFSLSDISEVESIYFQDKSNQ